jgi:uncharacterized protein (TIGR01244 family)
MHDVIVYTISEQVVLAGQPQPADWAQFASAGFGRVINLRSDPERAAQQAQAASAAGLDYLHLPLPAYELEPHHLAQFSAAVQQAPAGKLLIHCRTASRVALLWMLHRIEHDGVSQEEAEAELRAAGYDDDAMETFTFCSEDFFERAAQLQPGSSQ